MPGRNRRLINVKSLPPWQHQVKCQGSKHFRRTLTHSIFKTVDSASTWSFGTPEGMLTLGDWTPQHVGKHTPPTGSGSQASADGTWVQDPQVCGIWDRDMGDHRPTWWGQGDCLSPEKLSSPHEDQEAGHSRGVKSISTPRLGYAPIQM